MKTIALAAALLGTVLLSGCDDDSGSPPPSNTSTPTLVANTATPTSRPPTAVPTITPTATVTPTVGPGANITYFGLLRADNTFIEPIGSDGQGRPIYTRPHGSGFVVVVEARPGTDNAPVAISSFEHDPADASILPDLQILASRALGDGSSLVCDDEEPNFGGVPAVDPPVFAVEQGVSDAINDFACRFIDGAGNRNGRAQNEACSLFADGEYHFLSTSSTRQFCSLISAPLAFPIGDTVLSARVRNTQGVVGAVRQIVVRVEG